MRVEKINENKLKIVLSKQDLIDKNIDLKNFSKNTIDTQDAVFDILQEIESSYGFDISASQLAIEGISTSTGGMILTVTKSSTGFDNLKIPKDLKAKRKIPKATNSNLIYAFEEFDTFAQFASLYKRLPQKYTNSLYLYNNMYYWTIENLAQNEKLQRKVSFSLSDFADYVPSNIFQTKLDEYGIIVVEENAIQTINKKYLI